MQTRTYFASSVPAALEAARRDLGSDAVLVNSRLSPPAMRDLGKLEVTFQFEGPPNPARSTRIVSAAADSGLNEIRQELLSLRQAMGLEVVAPRPAEPDSESIGDIPLVPFGPLPPASCRRLAFIGPPGRGKTTSLVKIAVRFGLSARIPVRIYSAGAHGIGGQEQLSRYAAILGVPFQSLEGLESLHLAPDGDGWKGLTLIDTPGISPGEILEMGNFSRFFARRHDIEKHLVLRADSDSADTLHVISRFSCLNPDRLLFTGMDEVSHWNQVARILVRSAIPATFAGIGPEIPEGIEELTGERFRQCIRHETQVSAAVA